MSSRSAQRGDEGLPFSRAIPTLVQGEDLLELVNHQDQPRDPIIGHRLVPTSGSIRDDRLPDANVRLIGMVGQCVSDP